jgi:hypothetical protein
VGQLRDRLHPDHLGLVLTLFAVLNLPHTHSDVRTAVLEIRKMPSSIERSAS